MIHTSSCFSGGLHGCRRIAISLPAVHAPQALLEEPELVDNLRKTRYIRINIYIYIYIFIKREREREICISLHVYIYIYMYVYIYTYIGICVYI